MSRTYRRKHHPDRRDLKELVWVDSLHGGRFLQWQRLPLGSPEHARKLAEFHADNHPGIWNVPSWCRRELNRAHRAQTNRQLRGLSAGGEALLAKRAVQAAWHWF